MEINTFTEEEFNEKMRTIVEPWADAHLKSGYAPGKNNFLLRYYYAINPDAKGIVVFQHGFCGFHGKFLEMFYWFYREGYTIYFPEERGHDRSGREVDDLSLVHVNDFQDYVDDLKSFMDHVVMKNALGMPVYLFAHSMGGLIATLFIEQYHGYFQKAILSSPMHEMLYGSVPPVFVDILAVWSVAVHWDKKYLPGQGPWTGESNFEGSSDTSKARYYYQFNLRNNDPYDQTWAGTYSFARAGRKAQRKALKQAADADISVLLFQAENDHMVSPDGQFRFAEKAKNCQIIFVPHAKHEIFMSTKDVLDPYYEAVFSFLAS